MDGLFVRTKRPIPGETKEPLSYCTGQKRAFGMNFQGVCDAKYRFIAWTMNSPGSQNDRTAFKFSGFDKLLRDLPPGYFILGDAAYPSSDRVLVPYPGKGLPVSQDAYSYYQSQCRMAIEQAFGIMVKTWGILCRPLEVRLHNVSSIIDAIVRLHNFCRTRNVAEPEVDPADASGIAQPGLNADGGITNTSFETPRDRTWRPVEDQSISSTPRENIRSKLEVLGMTRPMENLGRNRDRTRGQ